MTNLFVRSGISFVDRSEVLTHIGNEMLAKGVVHDTFAPCHSDKFTPKTDEAS